MTRHCSREHSTGECTKFDQWRSSVSTPRKKQVTIVTPMKRIITPPPNKRSPPAAPRKLTRTESVIMDQLPLSQAEVTQQIMAEPRAPYNLIRTYKKKVFQVRPRTIFWKLIIPSDNICAGVYRQYTKPPFNHRDYAWTDWWLTTRHQGFNKRGTGGFDSQFRSPIVDKVDEYTLFPTKELFRRLFIHHPVYAVKPCKGYEEQIPLILLVDTYKTGDITYTPTAQLFKKTELLNRQKKTIWKRNKKQMNGTQLCFPTPTLVGINDVNHQRMLEKWTLEAPTDTLPYVLYPTWFAQERDLQAILCEQATWMETSYLNYLWSIRSCLEFINPDHPINSWTLHPILELLLHTIWDQPIDAITQFTLSQHKRFV